jgi:hypothetical protein
MNTISKIGVGLFLFFNVFTIMGMGSVLADDSSENFSRWRGGPQIGFSPYTGVIGAELQKGHYGLTIGMPASLGIRYYLDDRGYRWFFGAHAMYYSIDKDETKDGIRYENKDSTYAGLGFGYKWRWKNHWDLIVSLSIAYYKEELENDFADRTDEYISAMPGVAIGYSF